MNMTKMCATYRPISAELVQYVRLQSLVPSTAPEGMTVLAEDVPFQPVWWDWLCRQPRDDLRRSADVNWGWRHSLVQNIDNLKVFGAFDAEAADYDARRALVVFANAPAHLGCLSGPWNYRVVDPKRPSYKFFDLFTPHGLAIAFRGPGHHSMVSRRWLEHGPWAYFRRESDDLTLIVMHDPDVDIETAYRQAMPAGKRMGVHQEGGFIYRNHDPHHEISGVYFREDQSLRLVVDGRTVSQHEMLDLCHYRREMANDPDQPCKLVGYVFIGEEQARAHLHELWLRDLACWAVIDGQEVRLDTDYHPSPNRPDWALAVEARYAGLLDGA